VSVYPRNESVDTAHLGPAQSGRDTSAVADPGARVDFQLTDDERLMLRHGLIEWGGPARCTDELAVAMGFADAADLLAQGERIRAELDAGRPLSRWDWTRALLATEIVFASDVLGAACDWQTVTGLDDARSMAVLRSLQHKLMGNLAVTELRGTGRNAAGRSHLDKP
jgi:hypothetical protein